MSDYATTVGLNKDNDVFYGVFIKMINVLGN